MSNETETATATARPNTARMSPCGAYRYRLTRELGGDRPLVICGLNPSTATADVDDPTIRKEMGFAKLWQCGRLVKVNAYAYRATDPKDMKRAAKAGVDVNGPDNDEAIRQSIGLAKLTNGVLLVAWGNNIEPDRQRDIARLIRFGGVEALCLGMNKNGTPVHPLYIPYERAPVQWSRP